MLKNMYISSMVVIHEASIPSIPLKGWMMPKSLQS